MLRRVSLVAIASALTITTSLARASVVTWDGSSSTAWNVADNWDTGVPTSLDVATFATVTTNKPGLTADTSVLGLSFTATTTSAFTIGGPGHTLSVDTSGITFNTTTTTTAQSLTINPTVSISKSQTWKLNGASSGGNRILTLGNLVTTGGATLTIQGGYLFKAAVVVNGTAGTISGDVSLNQAKLRIANDNSIVGNLQLVDGVLATNTDITRTLGTGNDGVQITGGTRSGFSNYGTSPITVTILDSGTGEAATLVWGSTYFKPAAFLLGDNAMSIGGGGAITLANSINLNGSSGTFGSYSTNALSTLAGVISNSSTTKAAGIICWSYMSTDGTLYAANNNNSFNGSVQVQSGILRFDTIGNINGGNTALGAPTSETDGRITLGLLRSGTLLTGSLNYTGASNASTDRAISLAGNGRIFSNGTGAIAFTSTANLTVTNAIARTLTFGGTNTGNNTFAGGIVDGDGGYATNVAKVGTGRWILTGNSTYTGGTVVGTSTASGGSLLINGTNNNGAGAYSIINGVLGGSGAITTTGGVTVSKTSSSVYGTLVAGSDQGTGDNVALTINGNVTIDGTLRSSLNSNGVADLLVVNGSLDVSGATVELNLYGNLSGGPYLLVDYGTISYDVGTFSTISFSTNGFSQGDYTADNLDYSYLGSNGHYYIALVPEPSVWVMLLTAGLVGGAGYWQRRRRLMNAQADLGKSADLDESYE
jgi:fibronectin-binding autotransporter adhesin